ncbi:2,2-dialkylglycine decarboxylase (pyruvate) [Labedella gwakjiensis]|uniref:2,2-dialkylglycine decarboxylase (Pyruvate) n=1 Tax=Labedella gwakjiensis TaxID=390269 RepID=A0A2P8GS85_9MICO|nr:aspartate aminotransferase family protein [Labedella gwakjiensis]PSL36830.1 2,2-dialkylglycine decarboxylase (pyruvate) [Labedella gwakjiensis]RUQ84335.1 aspartate aminotransferase family protein [Labedella gwakjiensis]
MTTIADERPTVHTARSTDAFWDTARRHLIRYGPAGFIPSIIDRAEGSYLYDESGRAILDFTSGQMSSLLGHAHPAVVETVSRSIATLDHLFSGMLSRPVVDLAEALSDTLPAQLSKTMILSTGGESNEAAIKMAKLFTQKHEIVSFDQSYHGSTHAAGAATYSLSRAGYGPLAPGNLIIPTPNSYRSVFRNTDGTHDWRAELDFGFAMVDRQSVGSLAAFIAEPILGTGGLIPPPDGYFAALRAKCDERGMLLIIDEAQTGMCRTGDWYAFQHQGVVPDILTLSKTLGAGLPVSAVVTSAEIEAVCSERRFMFTTTHVSDPLAAAVGLTVVRTLVEGEYDAVARRMGDRLRRGLLELQTRHDRIGDVRGRGLFQGVELVMDRETKEPADDFGTAVTAACFERGLHLNIAQMPGVNSILRIAPPLTIAEADLDTGLTILDEALTDARKHS